MKPVLLIVEDGREVPEDVLASWIKSIDPFNLYEVRRLKGFEHRPTNISAKLKNIRADLLFLDVMKADAVITLGKMANVLMSEIRGDYYSLPHPALKVGPDFNERLISIAEELAIRYDKYSKGGKYETVRADGRTYYS
jgi:hypothetical protein